MTSEFVQQLIEAGIQFGHKASRWNPRMKGYIAGKRNTVHLINIKETIKGLLRAKKFIILAVSRNTDILFVGTKRQAKMAVKAHAERVGMHYVCERWLGGTLTNFRTIRSRLSRLEELEQMEENGKLYLESKKTVSRLTRERRKILRNLSGIRTMSKLPGGIVVVDARHEHNAILEARKLGIPSICLIDTDSDPDLVDIPIPGNDDAIRAIELIISELADAAEEGKLGRQAKDDQAEADTPKTPKRSRRQTTSQLAEGKVNSTGEPAEDSTGQAPSEAPATGQDTAVAVAEPAPAPASSHASDSQT